MEKAILYAINERMFSLGLIDEKIRDKIKAEISIRKQQNVLSGVM